MPTQPSYTGSFLKRFQAFLWHETQVKSELREKIEEEEYSDLQELKNSLPTTQEVEDLHTKLKSESDKSEKSVKEGGGES